LGGFELLVCYDSSALSFSRVNQGPAISQWEYFTYRTVQGNPCPSCNLQALSIVATRDLNNGVAPEPPQYSPEGILARICFDVSFDPSRRGTTAPIGFCLRQCRDNTVSSAGDGDTLYTPDTSMGQILYTNGYDTAGCPEAITRSPVLELRGGWVRISWPPLIRRGDINLDGTAFDVFDFLLFADFFFEGYSVWNPETASRQIPATDCNGDGEPLTVADLDYLLRVFAEGVELSDTLPEPYADTLLVLPRPAGDNWIISTRSSSPVSMLWLQLEDSSPGDFVVRRLGDSAVVVNSQQTDGILRMLVTEKEFKEVFGTEWADRMEISTPSQGELNIVAAQASRYPGVSMTVRVIRPINGVAEFVTVGGMPR
jgi:hypothetical protein